MGRCVLNISSGARCVRYRRTHVAVYFNKLTLLLIIVSQWISGNKHRRQRYSSHRHAATQWPQSHSVSFPINLNCLDLLQFHANKAFLRISQHPPKHPFFGRSERRVLARKWPFLKLITVLIARIWWLWRADVHTTLYVIATTRIQKPESRIWIQSCESEIPGSLPVLLHWSAWQFFRSFNIVN